MAEELKIIVLNKAFEGRMCGLFERGVRISAAFFQEPQWLHISSRANNVYGDVERDHRSTSRERMGGDVSCLSRREYKRLSPLSRLM
jgi:hypothetical protein